MRKKSKITTYIIILLLLILSVIFAYIIMQDREIDEKATKTQQEIRKQNKKEIEEEQTLELDSDIVKQAELSVENISVPNKYLSFKVEELNKKNLIDTALNGLDNEQINFCIANANQITTTITIDDLNEALNKSISDQKITIEDIVANKGETSLRVGNYGYGNYSFLINGEEISVIGGCDGRGPGILAETIVASTIKATTLKDKLYLYKKVAFGKYGTDNTGITYTYFKDELRTEEVETISINSQPTWEKYNTYKLIYEKKNNNYYLINSEKE
ncbi:MAG: hypothetical protein IJ097_04880 [Bacilli bacterium]|nr:hypothetical protein [Bacilli bacterium]